MKLIAFISAVFMLFLAVKPGITAMTATAGPACCGGVCTPASEEEEQDTPVKNNGQNTCNPFQSCCAFVSHCENRQLDMVNNPEIPLSPTFADYQSSSLIQYSADFWQPPRMV